MASDPRAAFAYILKIVGRNSLARQMGVTPRAVYYWRVRRVPHDRVIDLERLVEGRVRRWELRPDIYPPSEAVFEKFKPSGVRLRHLPEKPVDDL